MEHCSCGKKCVCCTANDLSISCGCTMEAKRYECGIAQKMAHEHHEERSPHIMTHMEHEAAMASPQMVVQMEADMRRRFFVALFLTIPIALYSHLGAMFHVTLPSPIAIPWLLFILTTPVVLWSGSIFITGAYYSLKAHALNMSVLIATGVLAAYTFSIVTLFVGGETFFEAAAMLVTFVLFGHWMEMKSRRGTSDALRALFNLIPPQATIIRNGKEITTLSADIKKGDVVIIKPGDKIPVDGVIISGESSIDESMITGESMPIYKHNGDTVIGGSINKTGSLHYRVTHTGGESTLAQIITLVAKAQSSKAPGQRIADKAAAYLVILAIGSGVVTFIGWYLFGGVSLVTAITFAISAIVIACPDALGLATPTAVAVGTGIAAEHNILIKDAVTLENTSRMNAIVLDKTGTLTQGKPVVTDVIPIGSASKHDLLYYAGSAQTLSKHPLSEAAVKELEREGIVSSSDITQFEAIAGHGVRAVVDGKPVLMGTERLLRDQGIDISPVAKEVETLLRQGKNITIVVLGTTILGIIAAADNLKQNAKHAVQGLQKLGLEIIMITGDYSIVAENIAQTLGISRVFAEVLPQEKADYVKKLQHEGKFVGMVGDGINDAPALAQANIGIAIGAGSDIAIEAADIVLMKSDPADILNAIVLSKAVVRKMKQNLVWAATYNILAIPIAAGVFYPAFGWSLRPEISALLMSLSSIIVATNAVLLKRIKLQKSS